MLAAAISYYAVFSLPPLLYALIAAAGWLADATSVEAAILREIQEAVGPDASAQVYTMLHAVKDRPSDSGAASLLAAGALLFAATGVFVQIQAALNRAWSVQSQESAWRAFVGKRILSFCMILGLALLLLLSLSLTAAVSALGDTIGSFVGAWFKPAAYVANWIAGVIVATLLFASMFRWMPDAQTPWKDCVPGALMTAVLFMASKLLIGIYIGSSDVSETYGAAGALALIMLWVYYVSMVLLFGAEVTSAWSRRDTSKA